MKVTNYSSITAWSLSNRQIQSIDDLTGLSQLVRLDLSGNSLRRLRGMEGVSSLGMLNISQNDLEAADASLVELRYLQQLRTLNIGENPKVSSN